MRRITLKEDEQEVQKDAVATLGTIIGPGYKRDAVHVAVYPIIAQHTLRPGEHVGILPGGFAGVCEKPVGIVDPYLKENVAAGQTFWLCIYPRTVTSLRHAWSHPEIGDEIGKNVSRSREWIELYADGLGVDPDELIARARVYLSSGDYWNEGGKFDGEWINDEFWDHYENVTGKTVDTDQRGNFFSCSC